MATKKTSQPLVSVIVPTYNSALFLDACLASIKRQTYSNIELIVVDNDSTDTTKQIAKKYTDKVYNKGPERSAQRNYGVKNCTGSYIVMIDSDMELTKNVVSSCVEVATTSKQVKAVIIPEESFGEGFWAQCKKLERSFYVGNEVIEAARFFSKAIYQEVGGYDVTLVSGEDWELNQRIRNVGVVARINEFILHNEGKLSLRRTLQKKYYYAKHAHAYLVKSGTEGKLMHSAGPLARYKLFLSSPAKLFSNPIIGGGMLFMKTAEFFFGGMGYLGVKKGKSQ